MTNTINFFPILLGCEIAFSILNKKVCSWIKKQSLLLWFWLMLVIITWIITGLHRGIKYKTLMQLFGYIIPYALTILWGGVIDIKPVSLNYGKRAIKVMKGCLIYFSKASYSIFLIHFITLKILMLDWGFTGKLRLLFKATALLFSIGIGCLGYELIEKPINRVKCSESCSE